MSKQIPFLIFFSFLTSPLFSQTPAGEVCEEADPKKTVAEVYGQKLTEGELNRSLSVDLFQMQKNIYNLKKRKTDEWVEKILLEKEATRKKLTLEQLIEKEVRNKTKPVSQKDIDKFYEQNKERLPGTKEQLAERIKSFLENESRQTTYRNYVDRLKKGARVVYSLPKPEHPRIELSLTPGPTRGKENAKVKIVEFSDFECPGCAGLVQKLDRVLKKYGGKVSLTFKAYPLSFHKKAVLAHQASLCAHDQGKFWPYHDTLFKNQKALERTDLEGYAEKLKFDMTKFRQCLDSGEKIAKVQKEISEGDQAGVNATPTFFVNGKIVVGDVPQDQIEELINEELKK